MSERKRTKRTGVNRAPRGEGSRKGNGGAGAGGASRKASDNPLDVGLIEQIVQLMRANDLSAIELRDGDKRVTLRRGPEVVHGVAGASPWTNAPTTRVPAHAEPNPALPGGATAAPPPPGAEETGLHPIKSPMVGTFYAAATPDAKPFVSVGAVVDDETDVCIIEAMKVFNNIKAECRGTVAKVLVNNGQTVEFGQTLFLVKPS